MPKHKANQLSNEATATKLDVNWWRDEFHRVFARFDTLTEVAEVISTDEPKFQGAKGFLRLRNVQARRASITLTARAVNLMLIARPDDDTPTVLKRQKLSK